jgi:hypothetical protein
MIKKILSPENKSVIKNILIAVVTSVLGATAVYLLGFNNKKTYSKEEQEEITRDGWRTYVSVDNIYINSYASLMRDMVNFNGFGDYLAEIKRESEKYQSSLNTLIGTDGLDKNIASLVKRRLEAENKDWPQTEKLCKEFEKLEVTSKNENWTNEKLTEVSKGLAFDFIETKKSSLIRSATDIEEISKKLYAKYEQTFTPEDFLIVQAAKYKKDIFKLFNETGTKGSNSVTPDQPANAGKDAGREPGDPVKADKNYFIGKWEGEGTAVTFTADGKVTWSIPANNIEIKGDWEFDNGAVMINIRKHPATGKEATWIFYLTNVRTNSITMNHSEVPYKVYNLIRK